MPTSTRRIFAMGFVVGLALVAINAVSAFIDGRERLLLTRHVLLEDLALVVLGIVAAILAGALLRMLSRR